MKNKLINVVEALLGGASTFYVLLFLFMRSPLSRPLVGYFDSIVGMFILAIIIFSIIMTFVYYHFLSKRKR